MRRVLCIWLPDKTRRASLRTLPLNEPLSHMWSLKSWKSVYSYTPTAHAWQSDSGNDLLAPYAREKLPDAIVAPKRIVETTNRHEIIGPTGQGLANQPHLNTHLTETARNRPYPTCDEMHIDTVHLTHEAQNVAAAIHMYIIFGVSRKTAYEIAQMTRVLLYVNQKSEFHSRIN